MGCWAETNFGIPSLVVKRLSQSEIMGRRIKRLLHVRKAQTRTGIVRLRVELKQFIDDIIRDGGEEYFQIGRNIGSGVDPCPCLPVGFVLFVRDDHRATEIESLLVQLRLVRVRHKVTVHPGLKLVGIAIDGFGCRSVQCCKVHFAHACQMATVTADR